MGYSDLHRRGHSLSSLADLGGGALLDIGVGQWLDDVYIKQLGAAEWRHTSPQQEQCLEQEVEGDPVQDGTRPELHDIQEGKHYPVRQQIRIVGLSGRVQCEQRVISRDYKSGDVGQQLANSADIQEHQDQVTDATDQYGVRSGQTSLLFENRQWFNTRGGLGVSH